MNFNQLCSINYGNTQQKRFVEHLEVYMKTNTNFSLYFFRFVSVFINVIHLVPQDRPGFHQRY